MGVFSFPFTVLCPLGNHQNGKVQWFSLSLTMNQKRAGGGFYFCGNVYVLFQNPDTRFTYSPEWYSLEHHFISPHPASRHKLSRIESCSGCPKPRHIDASKLLWSSFPTLQLFSLIVLIYFLVLFSLITCFSLFLEEEFCLICLLLNLGKINL